MERLHPVKSIFSWHINHVASIYNVRIFNGRKVRIENSPRRVNVWHHKALPSDAEQLSREWIFHSNQTTITHYFSCITLLSTIAFRLEYVLFYHFYAKITIFFFDKGMLCSAPLLYVDIEYLVETDMKMTSRHQK